MNENENIPPTMILVKSAPEDTTYAIEFEQVSPADD